MNEISNLWPVIQTVVLVGGGIWAVADIKGTTRVLSETINNLAERIDELKEWVGGVQTRTNENSERIAKLEASTLNGHRRRVNERD